MKIWKNITVSKASDGGVESKLPTHRLVVTDDNYQNKTDVGVFWTKESSYGKFLSGKMSNPKTYKDSAGNDKQLHGYVIVREDDLNELLALFGKSNLADTAEAKARKDFVPDVTLDNIDSDIPF